mmetsp:Transcript_22442/g.45085  ORF Transcript_22442/g.45085 Transcript_22442/m.45085 type:complete len:239 (-) Transcript_22442:253-969(-)
MHLILIVNDQHPYGQLEGCVSVGDAHCDGGGLVSIAALPEDHGLLTERRRVPRRVRVLAVDGLGGVACGVGERRHPKVKAEGGRLSLPAHAASAEGADVHRAVARHVKEEAVPHARVDKWDRNVKLALLQVDALSVAQKRHNVLLAARAATLARPIALAEAKDPLLLVGRRQAQVCTQITVVCGRKARGCHEEGLAAVDGGEGDAAVCADSGLQIAIGRRLARRQCLRGRRRATVFPD